ncbi:MAG: hypothetical protein V2A74_08230, partial [bacterium]
SLVPGLRVLAIFLLGFPDKVRWIVASMIILIAYGLEFALPDLFAPVNAFLVVPIFLIWYGYTCGKYVETTIVAILGQTIPFLGYVYSEGIHNPAEEYSVLGLVIAASVLIGCLASGRRCAKAATLRRVKGDPLSKLRRRF